MTVFTSETSQTLGPVRFNGTTTLFVVDKATWEAIEGPTPSLAPGEKAVARRMVP